MAYKTFTSGSTLPASDLNTYLMNQAVIVCTSGTHPGSPPTGQVIYETDLDLFKYWNGSAWKTPMPTKVGRVNFQRTASVTANTLVGVAPPTSAYHTASITDGSTSSNDTITVLQDCLVLMSMQCNAFVGSGGQTRLIPGSDNGHYEIMVTDWGGNTHARITWSGALLSGETVQIIVRNSSSSSTLVSQCRVAFIPAYIINA